MQHPGRPRQRPQPRLAGLGALPDLGRLVRAGAGGTARRPRAPPRRCRAAGRSRWRGPRAVRLRSSAPRLAAGSAERRPARPWRGWRPAPRARAGRAASKSMPPSASRPRAGWSAVGAQQVAPGLQQAEVEALGQPPPVRAAQRGEGHQVEHAVGGEVEPLEPGEVGRERREQLVVQRAPPPAAPPRPRGRRLGEQRLRRRPLSATGPRSSTPDLLARSAAAPPSAAAPDAPARKSTGRYSRISSRAVRGGSSARSRPG